MDNITMPVMPICIETQNMPDAIHLEENPSTILKAGDTLMTKNIL